MVDEKRGVCFSDWDLSFTIEGSDKPKTFEIKSDLLANYTGNIAIEHTCSEKPSGLSKSKADIWIHFIHNFNESYYDITYYEFPIEVLQKIALHGEGELAFKTISGGDSNYSRMKLLPMKLLTKYRKTFPVSGIPIDLIKKIRKIPKPKMIVDAEKCKIGWLGVE
jgi:hypothetical protein